jgi:RimJ/RimL family protein N-acetyltransferase
VSVNASPRSAPEVLHAERRVGGGGGGGRPAVPPPPPPPLLLSFHRDARVVSWLGGGDEEITEQENHEWLDEKLRHWEAHGFGLYAWFEADGASTPPDSASDGAVDAASSSAPPGRFVGRAGIHRVDPDVGEIVGDPEAIELMYALAFDVWGHGFAGEIGRRLLEVARDDLGRAEIIADTVPHNVRSRRVMEGLGFSYEREFWHDDHTMVLYRKTLGVATDGQAPAPGGRSPAR